MPRATASEIMCALISVCSDEEMLGQVLAIESIVMLGSKDHTHAESFIRQSIDDCDIVNAKIDESIRGL